MLIPALFFRRNSSLALFFHLCSHVGLGFNIGGMHNLDSVKHRLNFETVVIRNVDPELLLHGSYQLYLVQTVETLN